MRDEGNGRFQSCWTAAISDKKSYEHPQCRSTVLDRRMAFAVAVLQKTMPQTVSVQPFWGISELFEQYPDRNIVVVERGILGVALLAHPATKANQHGWTIGPIHGSQIDPAVGVQMPQKE